MYATVLTSASLGILLFAPAISNELVAPGPVPTTEKCRLRQIPFVAGLTLGDSKIGTDIYSAPVNPVAPSYVHPVLRHTSELQVSVGELGSNGIDALSFGADWISLVDTPGTSTWELDPLTAATSGPGWSILYYVVENEIFAIGWGGPAPSFPPLFSHWVEGVEMNASWELSPSSRVPLYSTTNFPSSLSIDAIDFSAGAVVDLPEPPDPPCSWTPDLASNGGDSNTDSIFFSVTRSATIFRATPARTEGGFKWDVKPFILPDQLGLSPRDDIDALAIDFAAELVMFSLTESSPSATEFGEEPLIVAKWVGDGSPTGMDVAPKIVQGPGGRSLGSVLGPRVRGLCKIDPRLFTQRGQNDGREPR